MDDQTFWLIFAACIAGYVVLGLLGGGHSDYDSYDL